MKNRTCVRKKIENTKPTGFDMSTERKLTDLTNYRQHKTRNCGTLLKSQLDK